MKLKSSLTYLLIPGLAALTVAAIAFAARAAAPPPAVKTGEKVLPFEVKATDGMMVKFPDAYKGKVVLLDFWATWCPDCRVELPNVTAAYEKYHAKGFDILGISLDKANMADKLAAFTKENKMPWMEVYDGKYWSADIAVKYNVKSIPHAFLVDGDTGLILADGEKLDAAAIEKALADKGIKTN